MKNFFLLKFDSYTSAILYCYSKQFHLIQIRLSEMAETKELHEISFDHEILIYFSLSSPHNIIHTTNSTAETIIIHGFITKSKLRKKLR